jgi:RecB family endonuclease NucS
VDYHVELSSKYTRKYDCQRAKCENPKLIQEWFVRFNNIRQKYGIVDNDIYNMDETGFQMGVISTAKIICGSETRESRVKYIQPGN